MSCITTNRVRSFAFPLLAGLFLFLAGCTSPEKGPTAPVQFMKEGRQWTTTSDAPAAPVEPAAAVNPDAEAVPGDRSAPTRPPAQ